MRLVGFHEKHGRRYFVLGGDEGGEQETQKLQHVALTIFRERDAENWYGVEELNGTQARYYKKAQEGDAKAALAFLNSRLDWEYEGFEIIIPEVV